jgi:hypothetical protein
VFLSFLVTKFQKISIFTYQLPDSILSYSSQK